jgi:hypothetical protein
VVKIRWRRAVRGNRETILKTGGDAEATELLVRVVRVAEWRRLGVPGAGCTVGVAGEPI